MLSTTATYYDGLTSTPHSVDVNFDERNNEIQFFSPDFTNKLWKIEDIEFQKLNFCLEISNKAHLSETLKIVDEDFAKQFIENLNKNGKLSIYQQLINKNIKVHFTILAFLVAFIVVAYIYFVPWVGEKSTVMIPQEFDSYLSNEFLIDYLSDNEVDSIKTKGLEQFSALLDLSKNKNLTFMVVKSEVVNAFALPNGKIIVFTGLLDKIKSPEELTALLCHEVIHINHRHSVKMLARNLAGYIFISAMFSDVNGIMTVIAQNAENLQSLSYSRKFETEADTEGLKLMIIKNVNPKGMVSLFQRIKEDDKVLPSFLSTHPVTDERIKVITEMIKTSYYADKENIRLKNTFKAIYNDGQKY
jgi:Zn-dependent protease with chaperone function